MVGSLQRSRTLCSDAVQRCGTRRVGYLAVDQVLAHRQSHLDRVGLVRDGNGVQLELVPAVHLVGLVHGILEHLLVPLLAQDGPDVHDLGLAAGPRAGAREEHRQQKQTHRVERQPAQRSPVPFLRGGGSARLGLSEAGAIQVGDETGRGGGRMGAPKKENGSLERSAG